MKIDLKALASRRNNNLNVTKNLLPLFDNFSSIALDNSSDVASPAFEFSSCCPPLPPDPDKSLLLRGVCLSGDTPKKSILPFF